MPASNDNMLQCYQSRHTNGTIVFVVLATLMAVSTTISAVLSTITVAITVAAMFTLIILFIAWLSPGWLNCGEKSEEL